MDDIVQHQQLLKQQWLYIMAILLLKYPEVMQVQLILVRTSEAISEIIHESKENLKNQFVLLQVFLELEKHWLD